MDKLLYMLFIGALGNKPLKKWHIRLSDAIMDISFQRFLCLALINSYLLHFTSDSPTLLAHCISQARRGKKQLKADAVLFAMGKSD